MQLKQITAIIVLLLVVASLLVAGCTTSTTSNTNQTSSATPTATPTATPKGARIVTPTAKPTPIPLVSPDLQAQIGQPVQIPNTGITITLSKAIHEGEGSGFYGDRYAFEWTATGGNVAYAAANTTIVMKDKSTINYGESKFSGGSHESSYVYTSDYPGIKPDFVQTTFSGSTGSSYTIRWPVTTI